MVIDARPENKLKAQLMGLTVVRGGWGSLLQGPFLGFCPWKFWHSIAGEQALESDADSIVSSTIID